MGAIYGLSTRSSSDRTRNTVLASETQCSYFNRIARPSYPLHARFGICYCECSPTYTQAEQPETWGLVGRERPSKRQPSTDYHFPPLPYPAPVPSYTLQTPMAYIIPRKTLTPLIGEGSARSIPRYLILSRQKRDSYRLEPLEKWLSRHLRRKRAIPTLSTVGEKKRPSDTG